MFRADLHIHSRFSRATSKNLTIRNLASWAYIKGIHLLGTGDCTHTQWLNELKNSLTYNEHTGFYKLKSPLTKEDIYEHTAINVNTISFQPEFILQGEISCIYKKLGATRKNHNLVFFPDFQTTEIFNSQLAKKGNLESDGRPILGLDAKNLLEMVLEHKNSYLIPAHIWTPWFSLFGSKSGFDKIEDCFEELTTEIFALETGLSSDPPMNRLYSALDNFTLISNSDAHSSENLAREVNIFHNATTYQELFESLQRKNTNFYGTIEFFPQEGKYHADGHRECNICFTPNQSKEHNLICPVCHKPLTIGVQFRVEELADRKEPIKTREQFESLIPLKEILAQLLNVGIKSKKITEKYQNLIQNLGCELDILQTVDIENINKIDTKLGQAILKMRKNEVTCQSGYDGEYGHILIA